MLRYAFFLAFTALPLPALAAPEGAEAFRNPGLELRPLQIVHGFDFLGSSPEAIAAALERLRKVGIGGLVANVSFRDYLRSEAQWQTFLDGSRKAKEMGFHLWLYDEDGYPSGAAGGLTLEADEKFEAAGLVRRMSAEGKPEYRPERMYEGTHCTENVYKKRRYINLLDEKAVAKFIEVTHEAYAKRVPDLKGRFEAIFTDEPSLVTTYIRPPAGAPPALPWIEDLPAAFEREKGYDFRPQLESLFADTGDFRGLRCDFYEVIAKLMAERYFGRIQEWCRRNGIASTGHLLAEELLLWHVMYYGDFLTCLERLDLPGIDCLNSRPEDHLFGRGFLVPKLAGWAAHRTGAALVMSETSDFSQSMQKKRASHREMVGTANLLYLLGVNAITSYYDFHNIPERREEYKLYNDHAGRLGSMLRGAAHACDAAVLYPIAGIQANFYPTALSMYDRHPSERLRGIDDGFADLCRRLLQSQIDFDLLDERDLARASAEAGRLKAGRESYKVLLIPPTDTLHLATVKKLSQLSTQGVSVLGLGLRPRYAASRAEKDAEVEALATPLFDGPRFLPAANASLIARLRELGCDEVVLEPPQDHVLAAHYRRAGREIFFIANARAEKAAFRIRLRGHDRASLWHPETGEIGDFPMADKSGRLESSLELSPYEGTFLVIEMEGEK